MMKRNGSGERTQNLKDEKIFDVIAEVFELLPCAQEVHGFDSLLEEITEDLVTLSNEEGEIDEVLKDVIMKMTILLDEGLILLEEIQRRRQNPKRRSLISHTCDNSTQHTHHLLEEVNSVAESLRIFATYITGRANGLQLYASQFLKDSSTLKLWIKYFRQNELSAPWERFTYAFRLELGRREFENEGALKELLDPFNSGQVRVYDLAVHTNRSNLKQFYRWFLKVNGKRKIVNVFGTYEGDVFNQVRTGQGKWNGRAGNVYIGGFKEDYFHGSGRYLSSLGSRYFGDFSYGKKHGNGVLIYANDFKYDGEWLDDKRHGFGIFIFGDSRGRGHRYIGTWKDDVEDGEGVLLNANGDRYHGDWVGGRAVGKGLLEYSNGDVYVGDVVNGSCAGNGVYKWECGDEYQGRFENGIPNGEGEFAFINGDKYIGGVINGKENGWGKYIYANGNVFEGNWKMGVKNGKGSYHWSTSVWFEGEWKNNARHGKGVIKWSNGCMLEAVFRDGVPGKFGYLHVGSKVDRPLEGFWRYDQARRQYMAIIQLSDSGEPESIRLASSLTSLTPSPTIPSLVGDEYNLIEDIVADSVPTKAAGRWGIIMKSKQSKTESEGKGKAIIPIPRSPSSASSTHVIEMSNPEAKFVDGSGIIVWSAGHMYIGCWREKKLDGHGRYLYANGDICEGEWKNDAMDGRGRRVFAEGHEYEGQWKEGRMDGFGKLIYSNGDEYIGEFLNGLPSGRGALRCSSGDIYSGSWRQGQLHGSGMCALSSGYKYVGTWLDGKRNGEGHAVYENKNEYIGCFASDLWKGSGVFKTSDEMLHGIWEDVDVNSEGLIRGYAELKNEDNYYFTSQYIRKGGEIHFWIDPEEDVEDTANRKAGIDFDEEKDVAKSFKELAAHFDDFQAGSSGVDSVEEADTPKDTKYANPSTFMMASIPSELFSSKIALEDKKTMFIDFFSNLSRNLHKLETPH